MFYILIVLLENLVQRVGVHRTRDRSSFGVEIDFYVSSSGLGFQRNREQPWTISWYLFKGCTVSRIAVSRSRYNELARFQNASLFSRVWCSIQLFTSVRTCFAWGFKNQKIILMKRWIHLYNPNSIRLTFSKSQRKHGVSKILSTPKTILKEALTLLSQEKKSCEFWKEKG